MSATSSSTFGERLHQPRPSPTASRAVTAASRSLEKVKTVERVTRSPARSDSFSVALVHANGHDGQYDGPRRDDDPGLEGPTTALQRGLTRLEQPVGGDELHDREEKAARDQGTVGSAE